MSNQKINVMHLIGDLDRAGAQEVVRTLIEYLKVDDCQPVVCSFKDGPLRPDIEALGVPVEILGVRQHKLSNPFGFYKDMSRIRKELLNIISKHNINIIQTHLLGILDFLTLTLQGGQSLKSVLWTVHNVNFLPKPSETSGLMKFKPLVHLWLYRLTAPRVTGFIAISVEVREALLAQIGSIDNKIVTISNGVDVKRYEGSGDKQALCQELGLAPDSYLAIVVGRLTEQKGHCYLIDAVPQILEKHPHAHFLFVGTGELNDELQAQSERLNLTSNVHFLGNRGDVPALLAAVDSFVMPSLWEGLAMALLESMSAAKPIIATEVSGTTEVMIPDVTGWVVPPKDISKLAEAVIECISDPDKARAMGQAAKQKVEENYSAQRQANDHLALYRRLMNV